MSLIFKSINYEKNSVKIKNQYCIFKILSLLDYSSCGTDNYVTFHYKILSAIRNRSKMRDDFIEDDFHRDDMMLDLLLSLEELSEYCLEKKCDVVWKKL
jgi:hypothetical protein